MTTPGDAIRSIRSALLSPEERGAAIEAVREAFRRRRFDVNREDREAWRRIRSKEDWERYRDRRIEALRRSLGEFPSPPDRIAFEVTRTIEADDVRIECVAYESRPGVRVTANLYRPASSSGPCPAILLIHSHHQGRTQGELQDMGITWARNGCVVLVPDQLGYGERREHRPGPRQDYRFRYITGMQLHAVGESLMGWFVWDTMRGVDLLLQHGGADPEKIVLIGAVAGGGDPAAVTAALDPRIACVVPFNFGGPQPETPYPLPDDAEESFDTMGDGSWESTRNLRLSGRDGFLPWVIVASVAPRRLIYAHEFSWDRERDPIWKRLEAVFAFYDASDHLDYTHGFGVLSGRPPAASHCNQVGPVHRERIHAALARWFGIPIPREVQDRRTDEALRVLPSRIEAQPLHRLLAEMGAARSGAFRASLRSLSPCDRRERLRDAWARLLGDIEPKGIPDVLAETTEGEGVVSLRLETEPGIVVPTLLLLPRNPEGPVPVVVGCAQEGKASFLRERAGVIARLLDAGIAVCLPDLRMTGETCPDGSGWRGSMRTALSATALMLGETLLGARLRDLRGVLHLLRSRAEIDPARIGLWGDAFARTNPLDFEDPPMNGDREPNLSEPLGGLLALFGGLYEPDVRAVAACGTLAGFASLLDATFVYAPHDVVVPEALRAGDLDDVAASFAPRPLWIDRLVDGRNRLLSRDAAASRFAATLDAYAESEGRLRFLPDGEPPLANWFEEAVAV